MSTRIILPTSIVDSCAKATVTREILTDSIKYHPDFYRSVDEIRLYPSWYDKKSHVVVEGMSNFIKSQPNMIFRYIKEHSTSLTMESGYCLNLSAETGSIAISLLDASGTLVISFSMVRLNKSRRVKNNSTRFKLDE